MTVNDTCTVFVFGVGVVESATCTVNVDVPAVVGVPDKLQLPCVAVFVQPVAEKANPAGALPTVTDHVYGVTPPLA